MSTRGEAGIDLPKLKRNNNNNNSPTRSDIRTLYCILPRVVGLLIPPAPGQVDGWHWAAAATGPAGPAGPREPLSPSGEPLLHGAESRPTAPRHCCPPCGGARETPASEGGAGVGSKTTNETSEEWRVYTCARLHVITPGVVGSSSSSSG